MNANAATAISALTTATGTTRPRVSGCDSGRIVGPLATLRILASDVDEDRAAHIARLRAEVRAGTYVPDLEAIAERLLSDGLI